MEQEWIRNDTWVDWKGNMHTAKAEFDYASSPVPLVQPEGQEQRDVGRGGCTLAQFQAVVNAFIRQQAQKLGLDFAESMLLTLAEVLGLRLYTGK